MGKEKKGGLMAFVVILFVLVVGLGGYIVYDTVINHKTLDENNTNCHSIKEDNRSSQSDKETDRRQEDESNLDTSWIESWQIDHCSYEMIPYIEALLLNLIHYDEENQTLLIDFTKYNSEDDQLIKSVVYQYLVTAAVKNDFGYELENGEYTGTFSINISKYKLDAITKTIFNTDGLSDYSTVIREKFGLIKINDNFYKLAWYATGGSAVNLYNASIDVHNDEVYIIADTHYGSAGGIEGDLGKIKVTVEIDKKDGSCHISKMEYNH